MLRRLAPVLALAVLSPFVAEFLLGDEFLFDHQPSFAQLGMLLLYIPFYGGAALLIREFARRAGHGWPKPRSGKSRGWARAGGSAGSGCSCSARRRRSASRSSTAATSSPRAFQLVRIVGHEPIRPG